MTAARSAILALLMLVLLGACAGGGPASNAEAKNTAADWLIAYDNGDMARYCDLSVNGQGAQQQECLQFPSNPDPLYTAPPEADKVETWRTADGKDGLAVRIKTHISTNPEPQWEAVGLLEVDGRWLVDRQASISGDPDAEGAMQAVLNQ